MEIKEAKEILNKMDLFWKITIFTKIRSAK